MEYFYLADNGGAQPT